MQLFGPNVRFGIVCAPQALSFTDYLKLWKTAEALGYDFAYTVDHFVAVPMTGTPPDAPIFEGPTVLSALAAHTSRIRCGTLVVGNTYRNPGMLAKTAATIDHVSAGRLELGLGAAWYEPDHRQYGFSFPTPARRIRMLGESLKIIRSLFTQPRTTFLGRYYTITDAIFEPKPLQQPLPLLVGGAGEQLTLRVVAESADLWNTFLLPSEAYQHKLDVLAGHCREVGRDPAAIRKSLNFGALVGETESEVGERAARFSGPPGRLVQGTLERVAERLLAYVRLGVGDFVFMADAPTDFRSLELLATRVAPIVRREGAAILARR